VRSELDSQLRDPTVITILCFFLKFPEIVFHYKVHPVVKVVAVEYVAESSSFFDQGLLGRKEGWRKLPHLLLEQPPRYLREVFVAVFWVNELLQALLLAEGVD